MLRVERADICTSTFDTPSQMEGEDTSFRPSMLYSVLPTVVSNHLPTIPSLRQSLNDVRNRGTHSKSASVDELPQPETPPPGYSSIPPSGSVTPHRLSVALGEADVEFVEDGLDRPGSSGSAFPQPHGAHEGACGIRWKYATLGMNVAREWLPAKLTPEETLSIQAALPQDVVDKTNDANTHALLPVSQRSSSAQREPPRDPTILHRLTASLVLQSFILMQFLLPYIKLFLSYTYQFERKHQITKRLVNTGVATVDDIGRKTLRLSQTVCQMNDGMVGQAINEMTIWWVRGVTGGVQQGLAEGLQAMRIAESQRGEESMGRIN
ncbi:hypothetical protein J4E83_004352 [Alternaria metachromatica]|uniref:uncharacterized protein n=1 Tax=Alternaria metachromatica TaxID=283354 RepID=UPI0020C40C00|nr:uncharacterized protein J4E83_004352 [Alternaria metachromatica]KAI4624676.1 hypothetical protein J4E83_004352 [Alternaria metachromatica]